MAERTKDCFAYQNTPPMPNFFGRVQYPNSGQPAIGCQKSEQIATHADLEHNLVFGEVYSVGGCSKRPNTDEIKEGVAGSVAGDVQPYPNAVQKTSDVKLEEVYTTTAAKEACAQQSAYTKAQVGSLPGFGLLGKCD